MKKQNAEAALEALKKALKRGDEVGAYLCCGQLLGELLALCYPADAPPLGERFVRLPETELGQEAPPESGSICKALPSAGRRFPRSGSGNLSPGG